MGSNANAVKKTGTKAKRAGTTVVRSSKKKAAKSTALAIREQAKIEKVKEIDAELKKIADSINDREKFIRGAVRELTQQVAQPGKELLEAQKLHTAKGQKGKGFKLWIEEHCPFSVVTGYNYVRLYQATLRKPKLLEARLTDAYLEAGIKKALPHRPAHLKSASPSDEGQVIEAVAVAIPNDNFVSIPIPALEGWSITAQVRKDKVEHCREHVNEVLTAMKAALVDFFKTFKSAEKAS